MALYVPKRVTLWPGGFWKQNQKQSSCVHSSFVGGGEPILVWSV